MEVEVSLALLRQILFSSIPEHKIYLFKNKYYILIEKSKR